MSEPNFNITDRLSLTHDPIEIFDIYQPSDLGTASLAPDGVMRVTLVAGARYMFHKNMTLPRILIPKATVTDNFEIVRFSGARIVTLSFDGDDTPHIWGRKIGTWFADHLVFTDISNTGSGRGTVLYDLVGGSGAFSLFTTNTIAHINFKQIARLVDMGVFQTGPSQDFGNASGLTLRINPAAAALGQSHNIATKRFLGSASDPDNKHAAYTFIGETPEVVMIGNLISFGKAANSFIHIDSGSTEGDYSYTGQSYRSVTSSGNFFRPDLITSFTTQSNADIVITSFADSTVDPGVDTTVNFGNVVDFTKGQVVLLADEAAYDGIRTIVRVADDQSSFDINVAFSTSGAGTLKMVQHTMVANKYTRDETVTISGTTSYNGTHQILRENDTSFHLPQTFIANDATGSVISTGRDQKSIGVSCLGNGAQANSERIAQGIANANSTLTSITLNTYDNITLTGFAADVVTERFTLTNAATGTWTYNDPKPFAGILMAAISGLKSGSTEDYRFTLSINGAIPVFASAAYIPMGVKTSKVQITLALPVTLLQGDTVQVMIAGDGSGDDITITDISILIK